MSRPWARYRLYRPVRGINGRGNDDRGKDVVPPYCHPHKLGLASGAVVQVGQKKCCKERKITAPPNVCRNIPF